MLGTLIIKHGFGLQLPSFQKDAGRESVVYKELREGGDGRSDY